MTQTQINDTDLEQALQNATGKLPFGMTNDYLFRAVFQKNNYALCGLIRSLLHIDEEIPLTAEITNPIILGESISDKEFRLDINVIINKHQRLNLEMQVADHLNWPNRSLCYLCRSFDQLNHGEAYTNIKPVIHIGFLDFTLFKEYPEFYSKYLMMNTQNHHIYSSNFDLRVLDLNHIELATDEDRQYQIDYWAALFKAKTWEDIKMISEKNPYINDASKTIYLMTEEERIQKRCYDREDYYASLRSHEIYIAELEGKVNEKDILIAEKDNVINEKDSVIADQARIITELQAQLNRKK